MKLFATGKNFYLDKSSIIAVGGKIVAMAKKHKVDQL
jgi:hypothetical protein